jgi:L-ascorbate metabolism protein UlaG (beta-lactamase superfamily)
LRLEASSLLEDIENSPTTEEVRIWGLGGAGFALRSGDEVIYIDPWLVSPDPARTTHRAGTVPFSPEQVSRATAVLSTHEHADHCDVRTITGINRSAGAKFIGPNSSTSKVLAGGLLASEITTVSPGDQIILSPSIKIRAFESHDLYEPLAVMFTIETPSGNILHSGDTSYFEGFKKIGDELDIRVALLNFGKQIPTLEKPYYMNAEKLARAARDLQAKIVVPMHWNLWIETREDPRPIIPILQQVSPNSRLEIIDVGDCLAVLKAPGLLPKHKTAA